MPKFKQNQASARPRLLRDQVEVDNRINNFCDFADFYRFGMAKPALAGIMAVVSNGRYAIPEVSLCLICVMCPNENKPVLKPL